MSEFSPLLGKQIKFLAPQYREKPGGAGLEYRQAELSGQVLLETPARREVQIGEDLFRYEDVTVLEVEGLPWAQWHAAHLGATATTPAAPPPLVRWNPLSKTVLNHETGQQHVEATNALRAQLGLPVPWTKTIGAAEFELPPQLISEELAAQLQAQLAQAAKGEKS